MPNTEFPASCELCSPSERTRDVVLFGKTVSVKNYICSPDGVNYRKMPEHFKIRLSIFPTDFCPAACPFCIAQNTASSARLDTRRLEKVLRILAAEDRVLTTSVCGGEPFSDIGLLDEVISMIFDILGKDMEVALDTNGMRLGELHRIRELDRLESVHVSRHHYDDAVNASFFGIPMPSKSELKDIIASVPYHDLFVLNCMLLKDGIHNTEEAKKMLEFALDVGAYKTSFIVCTPINDYCVENRVLFEDVFTADDPSVLFTRGFFDYDFCRCRDGLYLSPSGRLAEFYGRQTLPDYCDCCHALVYGADNTLRVNYHGINLLEGFAL